jgi:hypothetical protein
LRKYGYIECTECDESDLKEMGVKRLDKVTRCRDAWKLILRPGSCMDHRVERERERCKILCWTTERRS